MNTRTFALIFGIAFLVIGAGGFVPGLTDMTATPESGLTMHNGYGHAFGLFPVNVLHNIVHLLFGIWGLLEPTRTTFGLVPIYGNDVWLHALLALVAAYFGWVNRDTAGDRV